ncbi:hypothetical protein CDEST_13296 [Colletotrichum destructivum]|uniref:Uncharacterized protein n=1 Tax=Colletotrichum destructivum TaxID=34406 RepID=A0AAX4IYF9_9PEZI|nr:hypothetical protein CDEST_13296 [Colletotrichum destructivum]
MDLRWPPWQSRLRVRPGRIPRTTRRASNRIESDAEARLDEIKKAEALVDGKDEFKEAFTYHNRNNKRKAEDEAEDDEARVKRLRAELEVVTKEAEEAQKNVAAKAAETAKAIAFMNGKAFLLAKVGNMAESQEKEEFKEALQGLNL